MNHDEALELINSWHDYCLDTTGYDLTPILNDLERVETHLSAEWHRKKERDNAALAILQAEADKLPRTRYRMTEVPNPDPFIVHRIPVDCWTVQTGGNLYLHEGRHSVIHGTVIERIARPLDPNEFHECRCLSDAIIECTGALVAERTESRKSGPILAPTGTYTPWTFTPWDSGTA